MGLEIGPLHVRRSVFIDASPVRVWRHFDSEDAIHGWLDQGHVIHSFVPEVGATTQLSVVIDGVQRHFGGDVLVVEPGRELSMESQWEEPDHAWAVPTYWTFRLSAHYAGTLVELFHHGFERLGADAADQLADYESGWGMVHLLRLRELAESH